jgi:L-asparaginase II
MLNKIGLEPGDLKCGIHEPFSPTVVAEMRAKGEEPNVLQNNCSGKHAAMLALARHLGAPIDSYNLASNPVQLSIARMVSLFSGVPEEDLAVGIDGCGVPVFGLTVKSMALAYARLVSPLQRFDSITRESCSRITQAMTNHPELIGGTSDRLDTEIMRASPGQIISKVGAEGVYTAGIIPCDKWPNGFGLALKIEDGENHRARPTVVIDALRQLDVLKNASLEHVAHYAFFPVKNRNGDVVGEIRASFSLSFPQKDIR